MNEIYTAGYSGHTVDELARIAGRMSALVLDIRHVRRSRHFDWNEDNLLRVLGVDGYEPLPDWGNVNYNTAAPIELLHPQRGLVHTLMRAEKRPVILLCGCREYSRCHRHTCAELLRARGFPVSELEWPAAANATVHRAISLWQPWATLLVIGATGGGKGIETRHWGTPHRGALIVHAAKKWNRELNDLCFSEPFLSALKAAGREYGVGYSGERVSLPLGALIGQVTLTECRSTNESWGRFLTNRERAFGNYAPDRFGWFTAKPRVFAEPIPFRGAQGFFNVPHEVVAEVTPT
jgi:hypothetical protein